MRLAQRPYLKAALASPGARVRAVPGGRVCRSTERATLTTWRSRPAASGHIEAARWCGLLVERRLRCRARIWRQIVKPTLSELLQDLRHRSRGRARWWPCPAIQKRVPMTQLRRTRSREDRPRLRRLVHRRQKADMDMYAGVVLRGGEQAAVSLPGGAYLRRQPKSATAQRPWATSACSSRLASGDRSELRFLNNAGPA